MGFKKIARTKFGIKKVIFGCEARGDADSPYLTRLKFFDRPIGQLCLHVFHRSDSPDAMHDHKWDFWTLILWGGYNEVMPGKTRRLLPGRVVYRRAELIHRVELIDNKPAISLVWMGRVRRDWGFHLKNGHWEHWEHWKSYFDRMGC